MQLLQWPPDRLRPGRNPKMHPAEQIADLVRSIKQFGIARPLLVAPDGEIIAGEAVWLAARQAGRNSIPVVINEDLTAEQIQAFRVADNKLAEGGEWNDALLGQIMRELQGIGFDLPAIGFSDAELAELLAPPAPAKAKRQATDVEPEPPAAPVTRRGDIWQLGAHRLRCGDSAQAADVAELLAGASIDCVLTDPPYCSGGFQEAGRSSGSIGSRQVKKGKAHAGGIANDKLSTRGYIALLKTVLGHVPAAMAYVFTDWRMFVHLYDIAEASGYVVRNMLVWNKGTAGMGQGWRHQHELVLFGARAPVAFDPHKSLGNVIECKRTGNELHPTQKPVELIDTILGVADMAATLYDPFGGSGTVLLAAEGCGRTAYVMEMAPAFCDVIVQRWQEFTGGRAELVGAGATFEQIAALRASEGTRAAAE